MEELNDDELQELLGQELISIDDAFSPKDADNFLAYRNLCTALDTEPEKGLSLSFASNVRRKVQERLNRKSDIRFNLLAVAIFIIALTLGYGLLYVINQTTAGIVLATVIKFKWILLFVIGAFFCYLLVDQRLVKRDY